MSEALKKLLQETSGPEIYCLFPFPHGAGRPRKKRMDERIVFARNSPIEKQSAQEARSARNVAKSSKKHFSQPGMSIR